MKGLEISEKYYLEYGRDAIEKSFPEYAGRIAVGLAGQGSECFGYDDEISRDHDFEPGFCLWITREDYAKFGFELERTYAGLPKEFMGLKRLNISPVGGSRHGVKIIDDFYEQFLGTSGAPESLLHWIHIPHEALACACNGKVFRDDLGIFSGIRDELSKGYPEDVRLKKIAGNMIMMVQAGLYNYMRCVSRGENGAAQLCVHEFVTHTLSLAFLLNGKYEPFYKWVYRAFRELDKLNELENSLVALTELGNSDAEAKAKEESMEEICKVFSMELLRQGLIQNEEDEFEKQAFFVQNKIVDSSVRNMHIMEGI